VTPPAPDLLLVQGDPAEVELTLRALERPGGTPSILVARDGEEALDIVLGRGAFPQGVRPRLVLLDLRLPRASGLEVLTTIKSDPRTRALPVVVLSASLEPSDLMHSYQAGANSFVAKPVEFGAFRVALARVLDYWLQVNVAPPPRAFEA
jgi:two-component system response regulator